VETKKIVVVEGDPDFGVQLLVLLSKLGQPSLYGSGEEGLAAVLSLKPNLVVLGSNLPGLQAEEVAQLLRTSTSHKAMPIVICADWPFDDYGGLSLPGLGPDARFLRPLQEGSFLQTLENLMRPRRDSLEGQVFESHELLRIMGVGPNSAVYKARDKAGREVALKVLLKTRSDPEKQARRFERDAKAWAELDHPNVLKVYGGGDAGGAFFTELEYFEGRSLEELARCGPMGLNKIRRVMEQIADGLQYLHDKGLTHRDLNPSNIIWAEDGRIKIADFGIGQFDAPAGRQEVAQLRKMMGASLYMAPEARMGLPLGPKADLFSFGRIFLRLFESGEPSVAPPDLGVLRPDLPAGFVEVVKRMTDIHPKRRYDTAKQTKEALLAAWPA
jgi:tRNA A-37 threonylcarbamoyl transferase component Bud32